MGTRSMWRDRGEMGLEACGGGLEACGGGLEACGGGLEACGGTEER